MATMAEIMAARITMVESRRRALEALYRLGESND